MIEDSDNNRSGAAEQGPCPAVNGQLGCSAGAPGEGRGDAKGSHFSVDKFLEGQESLGVSRGRLMYKQTVATCRRWDRQVYRQGRKVTWAPG